MARLRVALDITGYFGAFRRIVVPLFLLTVICCQLLGGTANAAFNMSAYRFSINLDAANPSVLTSNPSSLDDTIKDSVIDTANSSFYLVGNTSTNWVIEKRSELHGSGDSAFGTSGQIVEDVASSIDEQANAIDIDPTGYIFIAGYDRAPGATNAQWRIEKRHNTNGNLCTAAECGTQFGTSGVVTSDPTTGNDIALNMAIDTVNGYIYIVGYDSTGANEWRIEKRLMSDGSLVTAFGTSGVFTSDPSNQDDELKNVELDPTGTYMFVSGFDGSNGNNQWRLEKRRTSDAALCTAANCGTQFGTGGVYTENPSPRDDNITALKADSASNAIYVGGYDGSVGNNNQQWRLEKLTTDTGTLITAFDTDGIVTSNPSTSNDLINWFDLDGAGGYLYTIGTDATFGATNTRWRIEKRNRGDGSLVTTFGTSGVVTSNPSSNLDPPSTIMIDVDRTFLWAVGGDRSNGATDMRWRIEQYQLDDGDYWLDSQDTQAQASSNITFRLRLLLHSSAIATANSITYKLQYATKSGTCDTGYVNENYQDVSTSTGEVQYYNNPSLGDGATEVTVNGEPVHGSDTNVYQTIEEANTFTNPSALLGGQDGSWDFTLHDSFALGAYCFRVTDNTGTPINTPGVVPEITFCKDAPKTEALLRHGTYFCEGTKKSFFWAS